MTAAPLKRLTGSASSNFGGKTEPKPRVYCEDSVPSPGLLKATGKESTDARASLRFDKLG